MKRKISRRDVISKLRELAFGSCTDAVRLAFRAPDDDRGLEDLDLTGLSEFKRNANGTVEVKLVDRLEALQMLLAVLDRDDRADANSGLLQDIVQAAHEAEYGD